MSDSRLDHLLLVVDVGNTNSTFGLFEGESLVADFRVETRRNRTSDEYYTLMEPLIRRCGYSLSGLSDVIISSVVPRARYPLSRMSRMLVGRDPVEVDHRMDLGLTLRYLRPEEMGADRLVNAAYAWRKWGAAVVVDFGTATTFDVVSDKGEYLGGVITPGITISMDALFDYASRLPTVEVARPAHAIGRSTEEAMQSGVYFGYVAMVDGLARRILDEAGMEAQVVATGGLAKLIAGDSRMITVVEPNLALEGLAMIYRMVQDRK